MLSFISNVTLLLSALLVLLYHAPYLKYRWFFAVWLELFPYLSGITILGWLWVLVWPTLRRQRRRVAIATLLLIICWAPILSWVGLPNLGPTPAGIRVMTYNLWIGNSTLNLIEASIQHENPDILFLCEITPATMEQLELRLDYPYHYQAIAGGNALFSRYPILEAKTDDLGVKTKGRALNLVATLQIETEIVTVIGVHSRIPLFSHLFHLRNQQLDSLTTTSLELEGKLIILGDFNLTPWSPYFKQLEQHSSLQNASRGQWIWATWYFNRDRKAQLIKIPIDHIWVRGFKPLKTWTGIAGGSDHKPIITVLQ